MNQKFMGLAINKCNHRGAEGWRQDAGAISTSFLPSFFFFFFFFFFKSFFLIYLFSDNIKLMPTPLSY
jgi:hypothetical protein